MEFLDPVRDLMGGGSMSLWIIIAGLIVLYLAKKAVSLAVKLFALAVAAGLFLGIVPWAGEDVDSPEARCAAAAVEEQAEGWRTVLTKRITVEQVSDGATCEDDGVGLASGDAVVRLRTFYDLPLQTWDVDAEGAVPRFEVEPLESTG